MVVRHLAGLVVRCDSCELAWDANFFGQFALMQMGSPIRIAMRYGLEIRAGSANWNSHSHHIRTNMSQAIHICTLIRIIILFLYDMEPQMHFFFKSVLKEIKTTGNITGLVELS